MLCICCTAHVTTALVIFSHRQSGPWALTWTRTPQGVLTGTTFSFCLHTHQSRRMRRLASRHQQVKPESRGGRKSFENPPDGRNSNSGDQVTCHLWYWGVGHWIQQRWRLRLNNYNWVLTKKENMRNEEQVDNWSMRGEERGREGGRREDFISKPKMKFLFTSV